MDIDDIMYTLPGYTNQSDPPSNRNPRDEALLCVTDLADCCGREPDTPSGIMRTERGDWYFPDGSRVSGIRYPGFLANRGPNEEINGQIVYGSVRLYRVFTPFERGRFRCELPSAADPTINQTLYANICEFIAQLAWLVHTNYTISSCLPHVVNFGYSHEIYPVIISASTNSTTTTAGERDYSLTCSATLFELSRLPSDVPSPNFQWSFDGSPSLPSGVTTMPTVMSSSNATSETYTSSLKFSPLSQFHMGMYTCRLGAASLVNSALVNVDGKLNT